MGIDPSSSVCGVSIIQNDQLTYLDHWVRDKKKPLEQGVKEFGDFLQKARAKRKLDLVVIERMAVARNVKTIRMVSYFESVGLLKAGEWKTPALLIEVSSARKIALGKGNLSKEEVYEKISSKIKLSEFDKGGSDEADAYVVALAGIKNG